MATNRKHHSFHEPDRRAEGAVALRGAFRFRPACINQVNVLHDSKRITERKQKRSAGITRTWVEIVAVFQTDGADKGVPAEATPDGEKTGIPRILLNPPRKPKGVGENDERPFRRQSLFEFHGAQSVGFRAHELTLRVAWRGFAFLVTADRVLATRKKAAVERQVVGR